MAASWPPVPILPPPQPPAAHSAHLLINALPLPPFPGAIRCASRTAPAHVGEAIQVHDAPRHGVMAMDATCPRARLSWWLRARRLPRGVAQ